ncbi:FABP family protein [Flexivirga meconopsidis]|uniref:FABP family protein n=1 Tax=Flexivirga meconopsidis TaxID=2977121 RepID=UPI0022404FCC
MPIELDPTMHPDLAPLAWLLGQWEGTGVAGYPDQDEVQFVQQVSCTHDGRPFLRWEARSWVRAEDGSRGEPFESEVGYWRPLPDADVELLLAHPTGVVELYYGKTEPAKAELRTDGVLRSPSAREYTAGHRLYGYVQGGLMWATDIAAMGHPLQSYASAQLQRAAGPVFTAGPDETATDEV